MTEGATTSVREVIGACPHDCPDTCSLVTTVDNGCAVRVRGNPAHPPTDGVLCTKVSRYPERTHHPERILTPLRRVDRVLHERQQIGRASCRERV
mgnify:CR=1 FL=1